MTTIIALGFKSTNDDLDHFSGKHDLYLSMQWLIKQNKPFVSLECQMNEKGELEYLT